MPFYGLHLSIEHQEILRSAELFYFLLLLAQTVDFTLWKHYVMPVAMLVIQSVPLATQSSFSAQL